MDTDEDPAEFRRLRDEEHVDWPNVFAGSMESELCRAWHPDGGPGVFVLDWDGVIRAKGLSGAELEDFVDRLVAEMREKRR